jgi:hypothetical protein
MTKFKLFICLFSASFLLVLNACDSEKEDPTPDPTPQTEFVASDADFTNFRSWKVVATLSKAQSDDGRAHTDAARTIWIKQANATRSQNGQYPNGTILVKEVEGGYGIVAMVKRGGTFNTSHQGWEWIRLDTGGKITSRNASNVCNNCHVKVKDLDYVFTKN